MTDDVRSRGDRIPHPEDCEHKFILKGAGVRGTKGLPLFQCEHCGYSFQREVHWPSGDHDDQTVFEGWNPKPEPEPEEDDGDNSGGFWS